jgi:hypothetical protein
VADNRQIAGSDGLDGRIPEDHERSRNADVIACMKSLVRIALRNQGKWETPNENEARKFSHRRGVTEYFTNRSPRYGCFEIDSFWHNLNQDYLPIPTCRPVNRSKHRAIRKTWKSPVFKDMLCPNLRYVSNYWLHNALV